MMTVEKSNQLVANLPEIPPQNEAIDAYIQELQREIAWSEEQQSKGLRTTDYTLTNFNETKRDRLWKMKQQKELIDSILITADGHRESVHMDVILELNTKEPFFGDKKQSTESKYVKEYKVKEEISAAVLGQIVYYAYLFKCDLVEESPQTVIALAKAAFKYGLGNLLQYTIAHMMKHCSVVFAYLAYELTSIINSTAATVDSPPNATVDNKKAQIFFKKFIEDHFEEMYHSPQKEDLLKLSFPLLNTVLRWNKLSVRSEETIWWVIHDWVAHEPNTRLSHLNILIAGGCLRLGRLSEDFIEQAVFGSTLFRTRDERIKARGRAAVKAVLDSVQKNVCLVFKDGYDLHYSKVLTAFCPRATSQLLVVAGGWVDGKTTQLIEIYDHQSNLWLSSPFRLSHSVSYFGFEMIGTTLYIFGGSNGREIFRSTTSCDVGKKVGASNGQSRANQRFGEWVPKANMLERRCYVSSAILEGLIYAIGGFNSRERVKKCERFDPAQNEWTAVADLNYARSDASAVTHGGRIYVAGGINDYNIEQSVEVYCPLANSWMLVKAMASPRTSFSLASFGDRIWALGGNNSENRMNSVESYDPKTDQWLAEAPMLNVRSTFKAITFMGELYAVGGYNGQSPIASVEKYVPEKGCWSKVRHLRHDRSGMALLALPNEFAPFKI